jgi:hypothetical protein
MERDWGWLGPAVLMLGDGAFCALVSSLSRGYRLMLEFLLRLFQKL